MEDVFTPVAGHSIAHGMLMAVLAAMAFYGWRQRLHRSFKYGALLVASGVFGINEALLFLTTLADRLLDLTTGPQYWVCFYALQAIGFLWMAFVWDCYKYADRPERTRDRALTYGAISTALLLLGVLLTVEWNRHITPETDFHSLGWRALLMGLLELAAIGLLIARSADEPGVLSNRRKHNVFLAGAGLFALSGVMRYFFGFVEYLSIIASACWLLAVFSTMLEELRQQGAHALAESRNELMLLHRVTSKLRTTFQLSELFDILMANLIETGQAEAGGIFVIEGGKLLPKAIHGPLPPSKRIPEYATRKLKFLHEMMMKTGVGMGEGIVGRVAQTGQPVAIRDTDEIPDFEQTIPELLKVKTTLALPLKLESEVYGVIQIVNKRDGRPFSDKDIELLNLVVEQASLAIHTARLHAEIIEKQLTEQELRVAREIQLKLIPDELPQPTEFDIHALYRAASMVSGDFYDFYRVDANHIGVVIADVAGKGVPGALVMIMTRTLLKTLAGGNLSTSKVLAEINDAIAPEMQKGMFVTAMYAILDMPQKRLKFSCAGHNPLVVYRAVPHKYELYKPRGMALGFATGRRFTETMDEAEITLGPGDRILLYTDGVTEARNARMEEFGEDRLYSLVAQGNGQPSKEFLESLMAQVERHRGPQAQYDDISMVTIRVK